MKRTLYRCDGRRCDPAEQYCQPLCFLTADAEHADPAYPPIEIDLDTGELSPSLSIGELAREEFAKPAERRMPCKAMLELMSRRWTQMLYEEVDADAVQAGTQLRLLRMPGDSEAGEPVLRQARLDGTAEGTEGS